MGEFIEMQKMKRRNSTSNQEDKLNLDLAVSDLKTEFNQFVDINEINDLEKTQKENVILENINQTGNVNLLPKRHKPI